MERIILSESFKPTEWETSVKIEVLNKKIDEYNNLLQEYRTKIEMEKCYPEVAMQYYCKTTLLSFDMMNILTYLTSIEITSNVLILKALPQFKEIEKMYANAIGDYVEMEKQMSSLFNPQRV